MISKFYLGFILTLDKFCLNKKYNCQLFSKLFDHHHCKNDIVTHFLFNFTHDVNPTDASFGKNLQPHIDHHFSLWTWQGDRSVRGQIQLYLSCGESPHSGKGNVG